MTRLAGVPLSVMGVSLSTRGPREGAAAVAERGLSPQPLGSGALLRSRLPYGLAPANAGTTA
jgi:hypothetical protein